MTEYELWSFGPIWSESRWGWIFHGYRALTFPEVWDYADFGYTVRKVRGDRSSTIPLFPILEDPGSYSEYGLD